MSVDRSRPRTRTRGTASSTSLREHLRPRPYYLKPATTRVSTDQELPLPAWDMIREEPVGRIRSASQRESRRSGEMRVALSSTQLSLPSIPACQLTLDFAPSEGAEDLPPAFYIGSSIPTMLNLIISQSSSLPHCLNPRLTMALTGRLNISSYSQTIISVSVCLAEGLALWKKDVIQAHMLRPDMKIDTDPQQGLPGGRFSLPLTVQIPTIRLPPSFESPHGKFAVIYELGVTLSCDNPDETKGGEIILAVVRRKFDVLPLTMPTRSPVLKSVGLWIEQEDEGVYGALGLGCGRSHTKWSVEPSIPTTTFSPASIVPISLKFVSMEFALARQVFVSITLLQRQHITRALEGDVIDREVIAEIPICLRWGRFDLHGNGKTTTLQDMALPIHKEGIWEHGMSTAVWLPANKEQDRQETTLSVDFVVVVEIGWPDRPLDSFLPNLLSSTSVYPQSNHLSPPSAANADFRAAVWQGFLGHRQVVDIPIIIGSVGEPRDALHYVKWQDVTNHDSTVNGQRTRPREFWGGGHTSEDGWKVAPPTYGDAVGQGAYSSLEEIMRDDVAVTVV